MIEVIACIASGGGGKLRCRDLYTSRSILFCWHTDVEAYKLKSWTGHELGRRNRDQVKSKS